jgi:hypothetical protein
MPTIAPLHGAMGDALWIFGGGDAASNADLAEVWTSTAMAPNGSTVAATMRGFPDAAMTNHPDYALIGATAVGLDASHAVVVGWYGPQCAAGVPTFGGPDRCDFDAMTSRSFTVDGMTGRAVATTTRQRHAFGAGVRMSDGSALVVGGIGALTLTPNTGTEHFVATVPSSGAAMLDDVQPLLNQARVFQAAAALDDGGVIVFGGLGINTTTATPSVNLIGAPEVMYLPRASM